MRQRERSDERDVDPSLPLDHDVGRLCQDRCSRILGGSDGHDGLSILWGVVQIQFRRTDEHPPHVSATYPAASGYKYRDAVCSSNTCSMTVMIVSDARGEIVKAWPSHVGGKQFPDVPEFIAAAANEAHICLSVDAHRAAVAMARAVVEATAKDHGVAKGLLIQKIEEMSKQGIISPAMKEAADEIRFAGNEVTHGDLAEEPLDKEDAEEVLSLMDAILLRVYQEPRQVERVRERRMKRTSSAS